MTIRIVSLSRADIRLLLTPSSIIGNMRLTKVLMDGGSGLNIMYIETLDTKGISQT
jgi:hypothetical protein